MTQDQIDRSLKWGIVFSIFWLVGLGSLYALVQGLRARKAIARSEGILVGTGKAWWCIIAGGFGVLWWFPIFVMGIINNF
jgi:hypothetical protein